MPLRHFEEGFSGISATCVPLVSLLSEREFLGLDEILTFSAASPTPVDLFSNVIVEVRVYFVDDSWEMYLSVWRCHASFVSGADSKAFV